MKKRYIHILSQGEVILFVILPSVNDEDFRRQCRAILENNREQGLTVAIKVLSQKEGEAEELVWMRDNWPAIELLISTGKLVPYGVTFHN